MCDFLIVGVTTDEVTIAMKGKPPIIPFDERITIVENIKYVDKAVPKTTIDNLIAWEELKFNVFFKGVEFFDENWPKPPALTPLEPEKRTLSEILGYFKKAKE